MHIFFLTIFILSVLLSFSESVFLLTVLHSDADCRPRWALDSQVLPPLALLSMKASIRSETAFPTDFGEVYAAEAVQT